MSSKKSTQREKAISCLSKVTKSGKELEQFIFDNYSSEPEIYKDAICECICLASLGYESERIMQSFDFGLNSFAFDSARENTKLRLLYVVSPPTVEEGKIRCKRCGSNSTISRGVQLRSADEPQSQLVTCRECGEKWRIG